jgi:hypothetical protein
LYPYNKNKRPEAALGVDFLRNILVAPLTAIPAMFGSIPNDCASIPIMFCIIYYIQ